MGISVNTNISGLIVKSNLSNSTNQLNLAIERMTTGSKLNHAKDNAANYGILTNLTTKINAYQVAEDNVKQGLDMVQTASSALESMSEMTLRLRALATQARNGTYGLKSMDALNKEASGIMSELYRIRETAYYNGIKLFNDFNSTAPTSSNGTKLAPNEQGFLQEIVERDTSTMDKIEDLDATIAITGGTYSISTEEGFVKFAQMVNSKKISGKCEFVLGADIDISNYCKSNLDSKGEGGWNPIGRADGTVLDGNGHSISGLYINRPKSNNQALIGFQVGIHAKNLGLINPVVIGHNYVGALYAATYYVSPKNCYVEGGYVKGVNTVGGLVGNLNYSGAYNCYTTCEVDGESYVGGLAGIAGAIYTLESCFSSGDVNGNAAVGGLLGASGMNIKNCAVYGVVNGQDKTGIFLGVDNGNISISNSNYNLNVNKTLSFIGSGKASKLTNIVGVNFGAKIGLQVGVNSDKNSGINFEAWFTLDELRQLMKSGIDKEKSLSLIDGIMEQITNKQTEYGAIENRLVSALEEISIKYENLVSTRSTLSDADIGKVSSSYIKMQILQNASATLLSVANQTPSIVLQLIK